MKNWFVRTMGSVALLANMGTAVALVTNPFTIATSAPVQNMVAGSSQQITYALTSSAPKNQPVVVMCTFTPTNPSALTYSFNQAGCSLGGVGLYKDLPPVNTLLTLTLASGASSPQTGTLTFAQTNGMKYTKNYSINITVPSTANRTITFTNYCTVPLGSVTPASGNTGHDAVVALTSSSVPAVNNSAVTTNTSCATHGDSDCSVFSYSSCIQGTGGSITPCHTGGTGCYCGGGACRADSDCQVTTAGTCTTSQAGTPSSCTICNVNSDCLAGAHCSGTGGLCYWNVPVPQKNSSTHYELSAYTLGSQSPDSSTITLTDYSALNGYTLQWGGSFSMRAGCTASGGGFKNCVVGDCGDTTSTNGACVSGIGPQQPSTNAEATFVVLSYDTYDVTLNNGATNAISMYPTPGSASGPSAYSNPYMCGYAGAPFQVDTSRGSVGASTWDTVTLPQSTFGLPINHFQWVDSSTAHNCNLDGDCSTYGSGLSCGLTQANIAGVVNHTSCGALLGYWSPEELCGDNASFKIRDSARNVVADCAANYPSSGNTYSQLAQCNGGNGAATSCFAVSKTSSSCCGCATWSDHGILVPTDTSVVSPCLHPNAYWVGGGSLSGPGVLPYVTFLKKLCPSCYVFSFDDKTATFNCPETGQSAVNYNIDFCP